MWIKYPRNGKYHCITPADKIPFLGHFICGGYKPTNAKVVTWDALTINKKKKSSICAICRDYYIANHLLGERASERWWKKWEAQKATKNERNIDLSHKRSHYEPSPFPSATHRERQALQDIQARKELEKPEKELEKLLKSSAAREERLVREQEAFAEWLDQVQSFAAQKIVFPGQVITLEEAVENDLVIVYLAEADPLDTLQSELYKAVSGYKTYVPELVEGILLVGTSSELGKAIVGKRIGDKVVLNTQAGIFHYTVLDLAVQNEDDYCKTNWQRNTLLSGQSEQVVYEGFALLDNAKGGKDLPAGARDSMGWSDEHDATRYVGYLARDGNSFGSFSSHDDYGDEAVP